MPEPNRNFLNRLGSNRPFQVDQIKPAGAPLMQSLNIPDKISEECKKHQSPESQDDVEDRSDSGGSDPVM